jgi:murein L,D-transpeptidase YafK
MRFLILLFTVFFVTSCTTSSYTSPLVRAGHQADLITVDKSDRVLTLWEDSKELKSYKILAFGANPIGHKQYEGDERTPEGDYFISRKNPSKKFHKFLNISYPNEDDKKRARAMGKSPGGFVGIHGDKGGLEGFFDRFDKNWTDGCITVRNHEIDEIYQLVPVGARIIITP